MIKYIFGHKFLIIMLSYFIHFYVIHLAVACYNLLYYYRLLDDKNTYSSNYIVYNNYNQLKFLIKTSIKLILHKELLFRIYLVEIMKYIFSEKELIIIWMIIFASFNIYYHHYNDSLVKFSRFVYTVIISCYLINVSILASVFIHCYTELLGMFIQKKMFKIYDYNKIQIKPTDTNEETNDEQSMSNKLKQIMSPNLALASKEEVEELLSNKKIN